MPNEWTIASLKEYVERRFIDNKSALDAAFAAIKEENKAKAISDEKNFQLLNELRQGVATSDQLHALEKIVKALETKQAIVDSKASAWLVWVGLFFTAASFLFSFMGIFLSVIGTLITIYVIFIQQ